MPPPLVWIAQGGEEGRQDKEKRREIVRSHVMKNFQANLKMTRESKARYANDNYEGRDSGGHKTHLHADYPRPDNLTLPQEGEWSPSMEVPTRLGGHFDPFDSLPVSTRDSLSDRMLYFYFNFIPMMVPDFYGSGLSIQRKDLLFSIALDDKDFFNALMLTTAIVRDMILLESSSAGASQETLFYKDLTLSMVQLQLQKGQMSIVLVAGLAIAAVIACEAEQASMHLDALERLIDLQGGITTFESGVRRLCIWIDYQHASICQRSPRWCYIPSFNPGSLPAAFVVEISNRTALTEERLPLHIPGLDTLTLIFNGLHQLEVMERQPWSSTIDQSHFINTIFEANYRVLTLLSQQQSRYCQPIVLPGNTILHLSAMACQLFLRAHMDFARRKGGVGQLLGRVRNARKVEDVLVARAQEAWEQEYRNGQDPIRLWESLSCLELLLWVLYVILDSCPDGTSWQQSVILEMRRVTHLLEIHTLSRFEDILRLFPRTPWFTEDLVMLFQLCSHSLIE